VRYIIDYYHDEALPVDKQLPGQFDFNSNTQITLDVRPAVDSAGAVWDRVKLMMGSVSHDVSMFHISLVRDINMFHLSLVHDVCLFHLSSSHHV